MPGVASRSYSRTTKHLESVQKRVCRIILGGSYNSYTATLTTFGLPSEEAAAVLADGRYADAVREEERAWMDRDVCAVPAFFFDDGYPVPGAQEPETFLRLLDKLYQRKTAA